MADRRRGLADEIFSGTLRMKELEDGYEFVFPGDAGWPAKLARMIEAERMLPVPDLRPVLRAARRPHLAAGDGAGWRERVHRGWAYAS